MKLTLSRVLASVALLLCLLSDSFQQVDADNGFLSRIKDKAMFETVKLWTHDYPVEARTVFEGFATKFVKDEKQRQGFVEALDDALVQPLADDNGGCQLCQLLFRLLKVALVTSNYTMIEPNLIYYCEFLIVAIDQRIQAKELCGGIIPLQAPAVCEVVSTPPIPTELEVCEYLNACFPSEDSRLQRRRSSTWKEDPAKKQQHPSSRRDKNTAEQRTRRQKASALASIDGVIKVAQLTDIHLEKDYATDSETECWLPVCCQSQYGPGDSRHYGTYQCNIPQRTMELFFEHVNQLDPDVIVFTGDIPPHTMWDESLHSQLNCTVALTETLGRIIKTTPIYPCIGNHEMFPTNLLSLKQMPDKTPYLLNQFANLWAPLANFTEEEIRTMNESGYYTTLVNADSRLRVVAMNTLYMYSANFYNVLNNDVRHTDEALRLKVDIVNILTQARSNNEKVIFIGHHVPGNSDFVILQSRWYQEVMANFSDVIVLHMSGHTHTDEFRLFNHPDGSVASMVYVSPSIDSHDFRNPSMRLFYLNATTYEIIDYEQYYLDVKILPPGSEVTPPTIVKLYSAKAEYGLPDLSPQSWLDLLDRFRTDPALLQKHLLHSHANAEKDASAGNCTGKCVEDHICRMLHTSYDDYYHCVNPVIPTTPASTITWPIITEASTAAADKHISAALSVFHQSPLQLLLTLVITGSLCIIQQAIL